MKTGVIVGIGVIGVGLYFALRGRGKESTRAILEDLFPGGFTASANQLDALVSAGYPQGSKIYNEAVDIAYEDVAELCTGTVSWSSELGYFCGG